jgi:hypothetical protein
MSKCELCGEAMPSGEEMFKYHGYSGPCPKPPKPRTKKSLLDFDDAGASDDEPVKGVTVGDIRAWFDERERFRAALQCCAADWISAPGTVAGAASQLSAEFRRRMEAAAAALALQ